MMNCAVDLTFSAIFRTIPSLDPSSMLSKFSGFTKFSSQLFLRLLYLLHVKIKWNSVSIHGSSPRLRFWSLHTRHKRSCTSRRGLENLPDSILSSRDPSLIFAMCFFCKNVRGFVTN